MGEVSRLMADPILSRLGLALAHFVWQGAALAAVAGLALMALRRATPASRYLVLLAVMLAMVACPVLTFARVTAPDPAVLSARTAIARFATIHAPPLSSPEGESSPASTPRQPPPVSLRQRVSTPALSSWRWLQPRLSWAVVTWALGVVLLSLRLLVRWRALGDVHREGQPLKEDRWVQMFARLLETVQVPRTVQLLRSSLARVPTTLGWLHPVILLPASALTGLTPRQLEAVIAHELGHVRRHDYLVNLGQTVVETLLFYHPAVWWLSHRIRLEREHCCDQLAVTACGNARTYAAALVQLAHAQSLPLAVAASGGSLSARLHRLAGTLTRQHALASWIAVIPPALAVASLTLAPRLPVLAYPSGRELGIYTGAPFVICRAEGDQVEAKISGGIVVWTDYRKSPDSDPYQVPRPVESDIYGYNLRTKHEFPICVAKGTQFQPAIDGNIVVWTDFRNDPDGGQTPGGDDNPDIYGYDLTTEQEFPVCTAEWYQSFPAISGDLVVWDDARTWSGYSSVWGRSLAGGRDFPICVAPGNQVRPRVSGTVVVWLDSRNDPHGHWDDTRPGNGDIYGRDLATGREFAVCTNPFQQGYHLSVSGGIVAWDDLRSDADNLFTGDGTDNTDIYAYDLDQRREFAITTALGVQEGPSVSGRRVVYQEGPGLVIYDLASGEETRLVAPGADCPAISADMVVWQAELSGSKTGLDIYGYRLPD